MRTEVSCFNARSLQPVGMISPRAATARSFLLMRNAGRCKSRFFESAVGLGVQTDLPIPNDICKLQSLGHKESRGACIRGAARCVIKRGWCDEGGSTQAD